MLGLTTLKRRALRRGKTWGVGLIKLSAIRSTHLHLDFARKRLNPLLPLIRMGIQSLPCHSSFTTGLFWDLCQYNLCGTTYLLTSATPAVGRTTI